MTDIHCVKCNGLLMKAEFVRAEVKCKKCGYKNKIDIMCGFVVVEDPRLPKGDFRIQPQE